MNRVNWRGKLIILYILTLLICQFVLSIHCGAHHELPIVKTAFAIQARDFRFNLTEEKRKRLEANIAQELASSCKRWFPFLEWKPVNDLDDPTEIAHQLRLMLVGEDNSGFAQDIYLEYSARVEGRPIDLMDIARRQLYKYTQQQPTQDRGKLRKVIVNTIQGQFSQPGFRKGLEEYFLTKIPIATEIHPIDSSKEFAIPILWRDLELGDESVLSARFIAKVSEESLRHGRMDLSPSGEILDGEWVGGSAFLVLLFKHSSRIFNQDHIYPLVPVGDFDVWRHITQILDHALTEGSLKVFMTKYSRPAHGVLVTRIP